MEQKQPSKPEQKHEPKPEQKEAPKSEQKKEDKDAVIKDLTNTLKHVQADFENYKKRVLRDQEANQQYAVTKFIQKLLPALDTFELALKHAENHGEFVRGMGLVHEQLHAVLKQAGVEKIQTNIPFNPTHHHALLAEESGQPEHSILEEILPGYSLNGTVLRPAQVKVAKKREQKNEKKQ